LISYHYHLSLPFNCIKFSPANTISTALKIFFIIEKSFEQDMTKAEIHKDFLNIFKDVGFLSEAKKDPFKKTHEGHHYLPHHAVDKIKTFPKRSEWFLTPLQKLHGPVAKSMQVSLPPNRTELTNKLISFRYHKTAVIEDIE
jgi:hypothetical protein